MPDPHRHGRLAQTLGIAGTRQLEAVAFSLISHRLLAEKRQADSADRLAQLPSSRGVVLLPSRATPALPRVAAELFRSSPNHLTYLPSLLYLL